MSWVATAVVATTLYSGYQQRKAASQQSNAIGAQQADDARKTAEAETAAQVAANARAADTKRRRRANTLGLGAPDSGGEVLGAGGMPTAQRVASYYPGTMASATGTGTALGAGAAAGGERVRSPRTPTRVLAR
jgi:hypothetical protein